jgi:hypothetical protein
VKSLIRFRAAPITTEEVKLNIFAPVDKIFDKDKYKIETVVYDDKKYSVTISGTRLTQIHRDILDIALFHGSSELEEQVKEDIPVRTFSLYEIQKHLKYKNRYNNTWLISKFKELKRATIIIRDKELEEEVEFNIIRIAKRSEKLKEFVLVFEELYMNFFENQISIDYKKLLDNILSIKHPQTKACIRYLLSFKSGHQINIDSLLKKVGVRGEQNNFNYYRKIVIEELESVKDQFNIELIKTSSDGRKRSDLTVKYTKHSDVNIYHPKTLLDTPMI